MMVAQRYIAFGSTSVVARNRRDDMAERIGRVLREAREERGLTQADVAAALRVQRATVAGWETGRRMPDYPTLQSLMRILGIPPERLAVVDVKQMPDEPTPEERLRKAGAQLRAAGVRESTVRLILSIARADLRATLSERGKEDA